MSDAPRWDDGTDEVEAIVSGAACYVRASDDLRPRVLEASRMIQGERRAQRCIGSLARFVALLALFTVGGQRMEDDVGHRLELQSLLEAAQVNLHGVQPNIDWVTVEAVIEQRRRQAEALGRPH